MHTVSVLSPRPETTIYVETGAGTLRLGCAAEGIVLEMADDVYGTRTREMSWDEVLRRLLDEQSGAATDDGVPQDSAVRITERLLPWVEVLNARLESDESLGEGHILALANDLGFALEMVAGNSPGDEQP